MTDVEIKVKADTRQARQGERELEHSKGRVQRIRERAARKFGIPRTTKALGAAAGFRMVQRFRRVGVDNVDPWTAIQVPADAAIQEFADNKLGESLKANKDARKETAARYAFAEDSKERTAAVNRYYNVIRDLRQAEEGGRNIVRQTVKQPGAVELTKVALAGYLKLLELSKEWIAGEVR